MQPSEDPTYAAPGKPEPSAVKWDRLAYRSRIINRPCLKQTDAYITELDCNAFWDMLGHQGTNTQIW